MPYKNFRINVIFRILLIGIALAALLFYLIVEVNYIRSVFLGLFVGGAFVELIRYVDRSNRDLAGFLNALAHDDFASVFPEAEKGHSFRRLHLAFKRLSEKFRQLSSQKEVQHLHLLNLVAHLNVGILCIDQEGQIAFMNQAFKKLTDRPHLHKVDGLGKQHPVLYATIKDIWQGERKLVHIQSGEGERQLAIRASEFKLEEIDYKLISAQDIQDELEEKEVEAWQQLIRILTHEIMNSVSPISSLSGSLYELAASENDPEVLPRLSQGLAAIRDRSKGLLSFTEAYRKLSRIPQPVVRKVNVTELFQRLFLFYESRLAETNIGFEIKAPPEDLYLEVDPDQIEQVMINLVKNAIEALYGQPEGSIQLEAKLVSTSRVKLWIRDNGPGISQEAMRQVFVPFFTTKETGSGIGLSLSRRMIQLNGGRIELVSEAGLTAVLELPGGLSRGA